MAELELKEVSYFYESGGKRIDILDKASYSFEKGTLYTIVGPSGSGKTTTLTLAVRWKNLRAAACALKEKISGKLAIQDIETARLELCFRRIICCLI